MNINKQLSKFVSQECFLFYIKNNIKIMIDLQQSEAAVRKVLYKARVLDIYAKFQRKTL